MLYTDMLDLIFGSKENISFLCIGKKGGDILSKNYDVIESNNEIFDDLTFENISITGILIINKTWGNQTHLWVVSR